MNIFILGLGFSSLKSAFEIVSPECGSSTLQPRQSERTGLSEVSPKQIPHQVSFIFLGIIIIMQIDAKRNAH